ncbi:hypothetical protein K353_03352 [Kitasatospora sp. SolWspMP-SS2h]|uniref:hypothetical protein n=1 Tax=Kitasatospora sp. SolWspMP-SS2h TaxID=1305729 RepID=UPI000DBF9263|nr:hypothetical protein [Kitasatospora sp. SolWspMP-SS2h]RAJ40460.1 hypothetical protein K353_03352 [Kitasatospora sp. SolWspMP-SS2h]
MSSDRRTPPTAATAPTVPTGRAASRLPASRPLASRLLAVLLLACAALLGAGTGAPARADATPATTATGASIAEALKTSPVYVDPAFAAAVTPAQQQQLTEQIAATGLPVKVVLVPLQKGDAFDGSAKAMAAVVQERLGQSPLIMVTSDDYGSWLNGFEWPADTHQVRDSANAVGLLKELKDAGLAAKVGRVIDLVATGKGTEVYKAEADRVDREYSARPHTDDTPGASSSSSATGPFALAAALVLALVVGAALVARSRRRPRHTAFTFPDAVFAADRAADEAGLRRQAADEVLALGAALDEADGSTPGLGRALDAYDAAGRVLDGADGIPDLAGVLALAAEGRAALAPEPRLPLCFFDPRHGTAARRTTWRPLGRRERVDVAVCADCGQALKARRSPQVLAVRDQGRTVPYFEVPADRSLWAATGYGSLLSGPDDTLAARVGTGQFTRAAHRHRSTEPHHD